MHHMDQLQSTVWSGTLIYIHLTLLVFLLNKHTGLTADICSTALLNHGGLDSGRQRYLARVRPHIVLIPVPLASATESDSLFHPLSLTVKDSVLDSMRVM